MAKFTLTAQLKLQAPKNVGQIASQIQKQLSNINVNVNIQGATKATGQLAKINAATNNVTSSAQKMGDAFGVSLKRFTAFSIASRAIGLFSSKLSAAVEEAISFQNEIVRLSQVTGESVNAFGKLTSQITNLSTTLGVSSKELLGVATILAQAGLNARDTEVAVNALAKTALAPTFGDIADTAEGAVAVIAQFGEGVGALERQLGAINEVSARFAVESEDLISVIRRTGGVFKASGGSLEELLALFTSVRATTREGAETIATGLRTIFTRLQRPQTIEYLKQFGIQLTDLNGKFVGPYEAIRQLSGALAGLEEGDVRFIQIAEELGGYRQIGKVIPLLRQFEIAEQARQAAIEGGTSLNEDAITAQQSLAVQFTKVREQFLALIRSISETSSFQILVKTSLNLASALIKIADALKPLIPVLATFAAIKFTQNIGGFLQGIGSGFGKIVGPNPGTRRPQFGGPIRGFATGGLVPGVGNGDTVPAMLTPGEFVIRKSSVNKLGAGTLAAMNENGYAVGGMVKGSKNFYGTGVSKKALTAAKRMFPTSVWRKMSDEEKQNAAAKLEVSKSSRQKGTERQVGQISGGDLKIPQGFGVSFLKGKTSSISASIRDIRKESNASGKKVLDQEVLKAAKSKNPDKEIKNAQQAYNFVSRGAILNTNGTPTYLQEKGSEIFRSKIMEGIPKLFTNAAKAFKGTELYPGNADITQLLSTSAIGSIEGQFFEAFVRRVTGNVIKDPSKDDIFDFRTLKSPDLKLLFGEQPFVIPNEFKNDASSKANIASAIGKALTLGSPKFFATGGSVASSDTVPALLTPGEFVFNKDAAQSIGYPALNRMNKKGIAGFAKGGAVGVQKFANGGDAKTARLLGLGALAGLPALITQFAGPVDESSSAMYRLVDSVGQVITTVASIIMSLEAFGVSLNSENLKSFFTFTGDASFGEKVKKSFNDVAAAAKMSAKQIENLAKSQEKEKRLKEKIQSDKVQLQNFQKSIRSANARGELSDVGRADASLKVRQKKIDIEDNIIKLTKQQAKTKSLGGDLNVSGKGTKLGQFLGKGGKIGQFAARGIGSLSSIAGLATKLAGPIGAVVTVLSIFSKVANDVLDYQGKYNDAIQEGNVAKAQELAVLKEVPGIVQLFGTGASEAYQSIVAAFGGDSVQKLKQTAKVDALAAKFDLVKAENAEKAAEALKDFENGLITAAKASEAIAKNFVQAAQLSKEREQLAKDIRAEKGAEGTFTARNIFTLGGLLGETSGARNRRIEAQAKEQDQLSKQQRKESFNQLRDDLTPLSKQAILASQSFDQFVKSQKTTDDQGKEVSVSQSLLPEELESLRKDYENQRKAIQENIAALQALNFGLRDVNANAQAATLSLSNLEGSLETGYNGFSQALSILEASIESTGTALNASDISGATKTLEDTLRGFGASDAEVNKATGSLKALQIAQRGASTALKNVSKNFNLAKGGLGPTRIKEELQKELDSILNLQGVTPEVRKRFLDSFGNLEIDQAMQEEIASGNYEQVIEKIFGPLGDQVKKDVLGPLEERIKQEGILVNLTKERIALERNAIEARKQAIDIEIEARKAVEEFGGPVVKTKDKINALNRQLNLDLGAAGVGGVGAGTAFELSAAQSRITSAIARREALQATSVAATGRGAFQGVGGVEQDRAAQLEQAQQAIIDYSRKRIELIREELQIAEKKNALEKSAFEKLVGGDFEGYIQDIQASAASEILRSGDRQLARLFGPTALGAGLKNLQEQGASSRELQAAAIAAGGNLRQAQVFAGTTPEMEALKQQGRQFAGALEAAGEGFADMQEMKVNTQRVVINAARIDMGAAANVQPFSRGGAVYASRGMFIPRGTDTVPAMLTPGEFVVNRRSVQAGNNLQILKAMNNGGAINNSTGGAAAGMARGGQVGYYMFGGIVEALGNTLGNLGGTLTPIFDKFAESIKQLQNIKLSVKLDTTNVNVNFNGAGFLATLTEDVKNGVLTKVKQEIEAKLKIGTDGRAKFSGSTVD